MSAIYSVGQAFSVEGREAVAQAVYKARAVLGNVEVSFGIVIASVEYDFQAVFNAARMQIGEAPIFGFSTTGELTSTGSHRRSVVVVLMVDEDLDVRSDWLPVAADRSTQSLRELLDNLDLSSEQKGLLLLAADGFGSDYEEMVQSLPAGRYQLAGGLAAGDMRLGHTFQLGGDRFGEAGLAGAFLAGEHLKVGIGVAHGWQPVGAKMVVTASSGQWLRTLDGLPAAEGYARLFEKPAREWGQPPLNTLVRLYPLGFEEQDHSLTVRSPLRMEVDGSLRMNVHPREGGTVQLLVGSRERCMRAAREATEQALEALEGESPRFALLLADVSWQMLFQGYETAEVQAVQAVLGPEVPIAGGYTFGQFCHPGGAHRPGLLNQHIEVVLFA
jgi:hypothetical protein